MTFIHGYLLAGLVLAGLPILVHLAMRQKPQRLSFAAFRFLKRRLHTNRRRMRLQHLLLLLMRIGVLAALCFALVRPKVESSAVPWNSEQPVGAVFLFDTRPGMEYVVNGESRLKTTRRQAEALLKEMAEGSRVVVLDSGDDPESEADKSATTVTQARTRIQGLITRPNGHPVNAHLGRAYRALNGLTLEDANAPRVLYIFSGRSRSSWSTAVKAEEAPQGIRTIFVDVGVEEPHDLAIDRIEVQPPVVEPGKEVKVLVTVRGTGNTVRKTLVCQMDNDPNPEQKRFFPADVNLEDGKERTFEFTTLAPGLPAKVRTAAYQLTARFETPDSLTFNDSRSATFLVRNRRTVLTIADDPKTTANWEKIFHDIEKANSELRPFHKTFRCEVVKTDAFNAAEDMLRSADIVCLYQARGLTKTSWERLHNYVDHGGSLILVPGGDEMNDDAVKQFNADYEKAGLLPGKLVKLRDSEKPEGVPLKPFCDTPRHDLTKQFVAWRKEGIDFDRPPLQPIFRRYWEVAPLDNKAIAALSYADQGTHPALLDREVGGGRVVMFTIPLERRKFNELRDWTNIWNESPFGLIIVDQLCLYLAGSSAVGAVNFVCDKPVVVEMLTAASEKQYILKGPPGLALSETKVPGTADRYLAVPQATQPGNYAVVTEAGDTVAAFSVNIAAEESRLDRVPAAEIETALGDDSLLPPGKAPELKDAVKGGRSGQVELMPWLLMLVLLVLGVESVLANKFYKREAKPAETAAAAPVVTVEEKQPVSAGTAARSA